MKRLLLIVLLFPCTATFAQQMPGAAATKAKAKAALSRISPALLNKRAQGPFIKNIDRNPGPVNSGSSRKFVAATPTLKRDVQGRQAGNNARVITQSTAFEDTIGTTFYDLQTNNTISNRLYNNGDGTLSAVWIFAPVNDLSSDYPERGTGYNYFNGTSWLPIPTARIEGGETPFRTGFPNIGVTSTGEEVVIGHGIETSGVNLGMVLSTRPAKGTGGWFSTDTVLANEAVNPIDSIDLWAKMAVGGPDGKSIHAIWRGGTANNKFYGQAGPILYSRSLDNGATWTLNTIIPALDSTYYPGFSADEYSIDANGNNIAIVAGDLDQDVVLAKSTDNGNSWTQEVVSRFPIPFFNSNNYTTDTIFPYTGSTVDTLWTGTGDPTVVVDNNGIAHVFFTQMRMLKTNVNPDSVFTYPNSAELFYWNETMSTDSALFIAFAPDLNGDGGITLPVNDPTDCQNDPFPYGTYGFYVKILEEPSAGVDSNNNLYVCYQTVDELSNTQIVSDNFNKVFKHPFVIKSTDGGSTWTNYDSAYDVVRGTQQDNADYLEGVYASMAKRVDSQIDIIYQRDYFPGTSLASTGTCENSMNAGSPNINSVVGLNDIIYVGIDTSMSVTGISELPTKTYGLMVSTNFPNPATSYTQFNVTLNTASNVKIDVTDILGQNVYSENKGRLSTGTYTVTINTAYLSAGVYFYSVTAGDEKITGKMVVR